MCFKTQCLIQSLVIVMGILLPFSIAFAQENIPYTDVISQSVKAMVKELNEIFAIKQALVIRRDGNRVYLNIGVNKGVTSEMEFSVVRLGEEIYDPSTKEVIGYNETPVGTVRVAEIRDKMSIATIVKEEPGQKIIGGETTYSRSKPYTIALTCLTFNDKSNALGEAISERLLIELARGGRTRVVERQKMDKALEELKLNLKEIIDPEKAKQFGKQVGADALVVGTLTKGDVVVDVNLRVINTESGVVMAAVNSKIIKSSLIDEMINKEKACGEPSTPNGNGNGKSGNLLINGDFSKDLSIGWKKEIAWEPEGGEYKGVKTAMIEDGGILHLENILKGAIKVFQTVGVDSGNVVFSVSLKGSKSHYYGGYDARASFEVDLLDVTGKEIGKIVWIIWTKRNRPMFDSPTRKVLREVYTESNVKTEWETYTVNLKDSFTQELIGVDPKQVKKIRIVFSCATNDYGGGGISSEIWAKDLQLRYVK